MFVYFEIKLFEYRLDNNVFNNSRLIYVQKLFSDIEIALSVKLVIPDTKRDTKSIRNTNVFGVVAGRVVKNN